MISLFCYLFRWRDLGYKNGIEGMVCYLIIICLKKYIKWNYIVCVIKYKINIRSMLFK